MEIVAQHREVNQLVGCIYCHCCGEHSEHSHESLCNFHVYSIFIFACKGISS
jgi:hypothetical protein